MQLDISSFFNKITTSYSLQKPFVAYRKPNEELVSLLVQQTNELVELADFNKEGFVFMPFHTSEKKVIFKKSECDSYKTTVSQLHTFNLKNRVEVKEISENFIASKEKHLQLISKAVAVIAENKAQKIVVSRKEVIRFSDFKMLNSFKKMAPQIFTIVKFCKKYCASTKCQKLISTMKRSIKVATVDKLMRKCDRKQ